MNKLNEMKYSVLTILLLLLTGCGISDEEKYKNVPHMSKDITEQNAEFKITHPLNNSYLYLIDQWWKDVEECTGISMDLTATQLHIEYQAVDKITYVDVTTGEVEKAFGAIWVDHQYAKVILNDLEYQWGWHTRHEMMHYILHLDGQNRGHGNPMFEKCKHLMGL